ncbi:unnamed protein product, partial [Polarella glacialis]
GTQAQTPSTALPNHGLVASTLLRLSDFLPSPTVATATQAMQVAGVTHPGHCGALVMNGAQHGWAHGYEGVSMMPQVPPLPGSEAFGQHAVGIPTLKHFEALPLVPPPPQQPPMGFQPQLLAPDGALMGSLGPPQQPPSTFTPYDNSNLHFASAGGDCMQFATSQFQHFAALPGAPPPMMMAEPQLPPPPLQTADQ